MKIIRFTELLILTVIAGLSLIASMATYAQAPAGPLTGVPTQPGPATDAKPPAPLPPPRTTILGAWKFNRDESDDPRKRSEDDRGSNNGGYGGRRGGGGYPGGGYPGGGRGGYGGPRGESDEERQKMHELLSPPSTVAISMTGAEVDMLDDRDRKRAFMTDGRKLQKSKDDKYQEIAAKFDGNRLITDEKSPRGGKMSRTFELSADGRQLYETLHMDSGRSNRSIDLRFVYDMPVQTDSPRKQ
jgi:hypothetical protein